MRCIVKVFDMVQQLNENVDENNPRKYGVEVSYMQIYQEKIFDLLSTESKMMHHKIMKHRNINSWQSESESEVTGQDQELSGGALKLKWVNEEQYDVENLNVYELQNA